MGRDTVWVPWATATTQLVRTLFYGSPEANEENQSPWPHVCRRYNFFGYFVLSVTKDAHFSFDFFLNHFLCFR